MVAAIVIRNKTLD